MSLSGHLPHFRASVLIANFLETATFFAEPKPLLLFYVGQPRFIGVLRMGQPQATETENNA